MHGAVLRSLIVASSVVLAAMTVAGGASTAASRPADTGPSPLGHAGRWLTDGSGRAITVHGFNVIQKVVPYTPASMGFGDDDAAFLAANGYTAVRLGVIWKAVEPEPGTFDDTYLDSIAGTVNILAAHGIYSLLDFHEDDYGEQFGGQGFPDWAVLDSTSSGTDSTNAWNAFWNDEQVNGIGLQEWFAGFWQHVAARFAGNPAVLGYDLMNEPRPGSQQVSCTVGICPLITELRATYQKAVTAIRARDTAHLVLWEDLVGDLANTPNPTDPAEGLSYHTYCPWQPTDNAAEEWMRNNVVCPPAESAQFGQLGAQVSATGSAALLTEFGSTPDTTELNRVAGEADSALTGWTEWTYHRTGVSDFALTPSLVEDPAQPPVGSNVDTDQLGALTRPYPYAVAGTPDSWSYDRDEHTFQLAYSTERPDGTGRFGAGSVTEIMVPGLDFPSGYAVTVHGGSIISAPGATRLTVTPCTGAQTVSVTVAATGQTTSSCS